MRALPKTWQRTAQVFMALGDEHRQRILLMFEPGEKLTVGADRRRIDAVALGGRAPSRGDARGRRAARARSVGKRSAATRRTRRRCAHALAAVRDYLDAHFPPPAERACGATRTVHRPGPPCTPATSSTSCAQRRFAPFFWTQFLGAGNDNVYKNALVIFVAYRRGER